MKKWFVIAAAVLSFSANAQSSCDQMVAFGYPTVPLTDTTLLCRINYVVNHDNSKKVAAYSAELLLQDYSTGKNKRVNAFKADPDLHPSVRAELEDYNQETDNYDRGHLTPYEDSKYNSVAALQTFYLSNMVPQDLHMNRGVWRAIENRTRQYAREHETGVYVVTGPVFSGPRRTIGNGVAVPDYLFKVIIDKEHYQGVAYVVPNRGPLRGEKPMNFAVPISEVERITGINFTPYLKGDKSWKEEIGSEFELR